MSSVKKEELKNILPINGPSVEEVKKYIDKYHNEKIVIKCGGSVLIDPDLFNLFGLIPWDPPSFLIIGAWPIAMGISMFIQQKLNPAPPDPVQAKIFMFFPLFLTVILAPFPAGLVIYWTFNNIFTLIQQYYIQRKTTVKTK